VGGGAAVALTGTFLPWLSSGTAPRSSFELFELIERLGFSPDGPVGWALRLWPIAPLLLVVSAVAQGMPSTDRRIRLARVWLSVVASVYVGATAAAVWLAPDVGPFRLRFGIWVTLLGAAAMATGILMGPNRGLTPEESEPLAVS
jgi:hypothetical protein